LYSSASARVEAGLERERVAAGWYCELGIEALAYIQLTVSQGNVVSRVHIYVCLQLGGVPLLMEEYVLPLRLILREDFALRVIPDVASIDKTTNV
jgi:hypothetical protein